MLALLAFPWPALGQKPKVHVFDIGEGLPSAEIHDLAQDPEGWIWVLTPGGVLRYDGYSFAPETGNGLPEEQLGALEVDSEGRLWSVTRWTGPVVYYREGSRWHGLPAPARAPPPARGLDRLAVVAEAGRTLVAAGGQTAGLWLWDGSSWEQRGAAQGLPAATVSALARFRGRIAVGTTSGLCFASGHDLDCGIVAEEPRLAEPILALHVRALPDRPPQLWVLSYEWMGYLDDGGLQVVTEEVRLPSHPLRQAGSLLVDSVGGVYFGVPEIMFFRGPDGEPSRPLGVLEGLPTDGATSLLLDRESNVWLGSARGLSMIESWRFLSWDRGSGLIEDEVTAVVEPTPGSLVLGHNAGLSFLDDDGVETLRFPRAPGSSRDATRVMDMTVDREGTVWVAAHKLGLLRLGADRLPRPASPASAVFAVELDSQGRLWASSYTELFVREGDQFVRAGPGGETSTFIRWLAAGADGSLYVSTTTGLLWRDHDGWHRARGPTPEANTLYGLLAEPSGAVWAGTRDGLYRLEGGRELVKVRWNGAGIDRPVYFVLKDRRGRYWFGTDDGVRVWDGRSLRHLTVRHGLAGRETNRGAGFVDHRGRVWIGTTGGVSVYQEAYDRARRVPPIARIGAVEVSGQGRALENALRLGARENNLTFHTRAVAFSREDRVLLSYRLDGFDRAWQGPEPLSPAGVRYAHLPPGRYRFRVAAEWAEGPRGSEASTPVIEIAGPIWRRPWFLGAGALLVGLGVFGGHTLRTRAIRARNLELRRVNVSLGDSVAERQRLIEELEAKNADLERFAYAVSHDLKTPLVTISGFLDLVEKDAAAGDQGRLEQDVERIRAASLEMRALLDDLLELSRVGSLEGLREPVGLAEVANEAISRIADRVAAAGAEIAIAGDLPTVFGERVRLLEVYHNLIENALKFMGDQPRPRIEIGARPGPGQGSTVCYVRDNGIGIHRRYHHKVFDLFRRLDPATEGTGVGLALVRQIIERHGGRIWLQSPGPGSGTTVSFTLPVAPPEDHTTAAEPP